MQLLLLPLSLSNSDFDSEEGWEGDSNPPPSLRSPVVVRFHMEIKKTLTRADFFLSLEGERNFDGAGHSPSTRTNQGSVLQSSSFRFSSLRNCKLHSFGENQASEPKAFGPSNYLNFTMVL